MLRPDANVDRYRVEELLGRGGMATVYRVRHKQLDTLHALKVLHRASAQVRERLLREGKVQAKLKHPNVVRVSDVIVTDGDPALLMELVSGPDLATWRTTRVATLDQLLEMFKGIVSGVAAAHDIGMVHRDLKPGNVLVSETGGVPLPKVTDFGLVKLLDPDSADGTTQTGVMMGTPGFAAPEQVRDSKTVDHRADLYALGCILYFLLCGEGPFDDAQNAVEMCNRSLREEYVRPSGRMMGLPVGVDMLVESLLRPNPEDRLPSCEDVLRAVAELRSALGVGRGRGLEVGHSQLPTIVDTRLSQLPTVIAAPSAWRAGILSRPAPLSRQPQGPRIWLAVVAVPMGLAMVATAMIAVAGLTWYLRGVSEPVHMEPALPPPSGVELPSNPPTIPIELEPVGSTVEPSEDEPSPEEEPVESVTVPAPLPEPVVPADVAPVPDATEPADAGVQPDVVVPGPVPVRRTDVGVEGDADGAWLARGGGEPVRLPARVTAGVWDLQAEFNGETYAMGEVRVEVGVPLIVKCSAMLHRCEPEGRE